MSFKTNQTKALIRRRLNEDLTTATSVELRYISPSGQRGSFPATIEDRSKGHVIWSASESEMLDKNGSWMVWVYVLFNDNRSAESDPTTITVKDAGK